MTDLDQLRYPTGSFSPKPSLTARERAELIEEIAHFPSDLRFMVSSMSETSLDTPYREGGWTGRQVIHHLPDSHLNAYVRFKLALTEDTPTIRPYDESAWADTSEVEKTPVDVSVDLLDSLHQRWATLLRSMPEEDFALKVNHPEIGVASLDLFVQMYAWHGKHHLGHLQLVAEGER
jgi:hypothetical protein